MSKLFLNKGLYTEDNILKVVVLYHNLADIYVADEKQYYCLTFQNCRFDENRTMREFENYLISTQYQGERNAKY